MCDVDFLGFTEVGAVEAVLQQETCGGLRSDLAPSQSDGGLNRHNSVRIFAQRVAT